MNTIPPSMRLTLLNAAYKIDQTIDIETLHDRRTREKLIVAQTTDDDLLIIVSKVDGVWQIGFDLDAGQEVSVRADTGYADILQLVPHSGELSVKFKAPVPDKK